MPNNNKQMFGKCRAVTSAFCLMTSFGDALKETEQAVQREKTKNKDIPFNFGGMS